MTTGKYYLKKNFHSRVVLCHCGPTCFDGDWNGIVMIEKLCLLWRTDDATDVMKRQSLFQIDTSTSEKKKNTWQSRRKRQILVNRRRKILTNTADAKAWSTRARGHSSLGAALSLWTILYFFDIIVMYIWKRVFLCIYWISFFGNLLNFESGGKILWSRE